MNPMNSKERYNEDIIKVLEKIKGICNNALNKAIKLMNFSKDISQTIL